MAAIAQSVATPRLTHLDVLVDAGLVTRKKTGRTVACTFTGERAELAGKWLEERRRVWNARFDRLDAYLRGKQAWRLQ